MPCPSPPPCHFAERLLRHGGTALLAVCMAFVAGQGIAQPLSPVLAMFDAPAAAPYAGEPYAADPHVAEPYAADAYAGEWITDQPTGAPLADDNLVLSDYCSEGCCPPGCWCPQLLPDGLIYRSYMAGPREARFQLNQMEEVSSNQTLWDVTLGGRRAIWRYGTCNDLRPEGWELDIEGAAFVRLNLDQNRDVDSSDFRFGVPLTYGWGKWQYKTGYYHLSSHLGDELMVRMPSAVRKNYVRDAIIFGVSYNPTLDWRLYGETAYAFFTAGGAEPWEFQFGLEYSKFGPTGRMGTPFFATNGHLRQEIDFGGDYTLQLGWLWRGNSGSMFRMGFQFLTGHSNYYQFFDESEEQYGLGIWYDY